MLGSFFIFLSLIQDVVVIFFWFYPPSIKIMNRNEEVGREMDGRYLCSHYLPGHSPDRDYDLLTL